MKLYKVASFEINHIPLLEEIGKTKKPVIVSTGTADIKDIDLAIKTLKKNGSKEIAILHCISAYPSKPYNYNLNFINKLKKFGVPVGLSDHTIGNVVATTSIGMGVKIGILQRLMYRLVQKYQGRFHHHHKLFFL